METNTVCNLSNHQNWTTAKPESHLLTISMITDDTMSSHRLIIIMKKKMKVSLENSF